MSDGDEGTGGPGSGRASPRARLRRLAHLVAGLALVVTACSAVDPGADSSGGGIADVATPTTNSAGLETAPSGQTSPEPPPPAPGAAEGTSPADQTSQVPTGIEQSSPPAQQGPLASGSAPPDPPSVPPPDPSPVSPPPTSTPPTPAAGSVPGDPRTPPIGVPRSQDDSAAADPPPGDEQPPPPTGGDSTPPAGAPDQPPAAHAAVPEPRAVALQAAAPAAAVEGRVAASFDWGMPARFGLDANRNGIVDVPNTYEYVHGLPAGSCPRRDCAATFPVEFTGQVVVVDPALIVMLRPATGGARTPSVTYAWTVRRAGSATAVRTSSDAGPTWQTRLPEGTYDVTLDVTWRLGEVTATDAATSRVRVDDILIVSVGDSMSSGEGNPEVARKAGDESAVWADDGDGGRLSSEVDQFHHVSHRSTTAWPARLALAVEAADPRTSVTFVHVAASGSTIHRGLLHSYNGVEPFTDLWMPSALDQVASMLGCRDRPSEPYRADQCDRKIDALTLSIGVNDLGFSDIITLLVEAEPPTWVWALVEHLTSLPVTALAAFLDNELITRAVELAQRNLAKLPAAYDELAAAIRARLDVYQTYIIEYPDPTGDLDAGEPVWCDEIVGDVVTGFEIDLLEEHILIGAMFLPLNQAAAEAAARHGWRYIGGIADVFGFEGHGYCAPPGRRWFRTAQESYDMQGLRSGSRRDTKGTLHPNGAGHRFMAQAALHELILQAANGAVGYVEGDDRLAGATLLSTSATSDAYDPCATLGCALHFSTDVDLFRLAIPGSNQRMRFGVRPAPGSPTLEARLRLFDDAGRDITPCAVTGPPRLGGACVVKLGTRFDVTFPAEGTYYLGVSLPGNEQYDPVTGDGDQPGTGRGRYRLVAYNVPGEPDNTLATANALPPGRTIAGFATESDTDVDMFAIEVTGMARVAVEGLASPAGEPTPAMPIGPLGVSVGSLVARGGFAIRVFGRTGAEIAAGRDAVTFGPLSGTYFVGVSRAGRGSYDPAVGVAGHSPAALPSLATRYRVRFDTGRVLPVPRPPAAVRPAPPDYRASLPPGECAAACAWLLWLTDPVPGLEGGPWPLHALDDAATVGAVELVECDLDAARGCVLYSAPSAAAFQDTFRLRLSDPAGSGVVSDWAEVTLCVHC